MRLCGLGLRLQGCFQLLRGHISLRDVFLDILNDLRLDGLARILDLNVTDKEGLAFSKLALFLLDLVPQVIIGFLQSCLVRDHHSLLHRCSLAAFDLQGALFQVGAVNRNRGTVLRKGSGGSVQLNCAGLNLELLCQHCLGILRRQNIFFLFRSGIGDIFVVLVSTGEVALFILCIGLAVVGQGVAVLCNCPILVALKGERFVVQRLRIRGLFLGGLGHRPRHGGSILKPDIGIACGCQFFQGLAACLFHQVLLSQPIQLLRGHAGSVTVGDGVGRGNRISVIIRGGKLIAGELSVDIDLLRSIRYIEHTGIAHGCGILAFLALRSPADGAACHIRRAFNGIFLHIDDVLGLLAGVGCICGLSFRNLCPSGAVGQGVGFAANLCRKGVALVQLLLRKFQVGDFCLQLAGGSRVLNAQLVHCLGQGAPDGIFLGFFRSDLLTGGSRVALLRGRQGHFISEAPAEKFVLRYVQLDGLVVRGGVVDLTVRTQFVVLVAIFFQSVNDLCVAQLRFSGLGSLLNNVLLAVLGEMDSVIHHCTLIEHLFQILGLNGLNHCIVVALDLDTGVCHLVSERFTAILLCLFPGDGQLGGGLGGDLVVPNGDVGGAGLGVALCVQNGLGPGEGIGAVGVHRGLFGIHQLGDVFGSHLSGLGIFLAEHQSLLVAIVRVGHFLYLVVVDRLIALFNIPADVRLLAQLFL